MLMVLTVVVLLLLLLGVGLLVVVVGRNGKVLLQQNLLAGGGVAAAAVVMAAATRAGSVAALAAAAAVCAVGNHLRCASGVCLILQCKITKVVERPGVHYRGRHSPGIFVRWVLPAGSAGSFPSLTAVFCSISRFTERNSSFFRLNCSLCSNLHWIFLLRTKIFHVHIHALPMLIFLLLFLFSLGVIRKCTIFALLQRMIFSLSLHLHFWLLFSDFPWIFPTFLQTTLLLFLIDFWFAEPFRQLILLKRRRIFDTGSEIPCFDRTGTTRRAISVRLLAGVW